MNSNDDMTNKHTRFPGFPPEPVTNYWPYPKALNGWWRALTPYEQKVLDYLLRHTWGYKKDADSIAHSQFLHGIIKRDGTELDGGTGIKDERTIRKALRGLALKGFITSRPVSGKENIYKLKIDPSQEMTLPSVDDTSPPTQDVGGNPSHDMSPTIKDISINNNNNIPVKQDLQNNPSKKGEISFVIGYLSMKLGIKFPNFGKQAKYAKSILDAGYAVEDIRWAIDMMTSDPWWSEHSFDMKNVADEIPKLMTRTFKSGGKS